jgi:hypothetical protein
MEVAEKIDILNYVVNEQTYKQMAASAQNCVLRTALLNLLYVGGNHFRGCLITLYMSSIVSFS